MRITILSREFPPGPGGIGTHACQLANEFAAFGWRVSVVTPQDYAADEEIREFNASLPYPIVRLPSRRGLAIEAVHRWKVLSEHLRRFSPDVLLASGQRSVWLGSLLAARHGLPCVAIGHGSEFGAASGWKHWLTRRSYQRAAAVICVSEFTWRFMESRNIQPRAGRIIPNGADETRFVKYSDDEVQRFRRKIGMQDARILLTVGNVTERKGQEVVIRALPQILEAHPNTHYCMAGLPTLRPQLSMLASELGVGDHVHFLGRTDARTLLAYMNACDVFVMTSRQTREGDCEGFGIAVVEAALCGKPAVVSAGSGLAEAIVDGETGLTVPQGNPQAAAEAIRRLLDDDALRGRMGEAARRRALAEQTSRRRAEQYDRFLRELVRPVAERRQTEPVATM